MVISLDERQRRRGLKYIVSLLEIPWLIFCDVKLGTFGERYNVQGHEKK